MAQWNRVPLIDYIELIGGGTPKTTVPEYWNGNIPWLSVKDFNNDKRYVYSTEKHISQSGFENSPTKMLHKDDIIISARGTVGEIAMIPFDMAFNQSCYGIRASRGIDQPFLYYLLKNCISQLKRMTHGSVFDTITRDTFANIEVDIPDAETQKRISSVLADIDNKIEVNDAINDNLHQQAATLFKALFVDLTPFDGTMPPNWTISTLGDATEMGAGGDKPKESSPVKTPLCPYPIYSNGINDYGLYGYTNDPKIKVESVTVSARGTIGYVCLRHTPYVPIVRLVTLIPDTKVLSAKYLYLYLRQLHITGTGTTQQQLTVPDFRKTEIIIPDKNTMDSFTETVTPLFEQIWANEDENTKLAEGRDALLPKLMSGEIDVSDIQL